MDCEHSIKDGRFTVIDKDDPIEERWLEYSKDATEGKKQKIELALQLANRLLKEFNQDKEKFRKDQSPKVCRLLRQFKSIYESSYGADEWTSAMRDITDEFQRQERVFCYGNEDYKRHDGKHWSGIIEKAKR
tara:strand:- start:512 stop:907 length:396 start_codon:yes stop_codon:yes gene_type:complete